MQIIQLNHEQVIEIAEQLLDNGAEQQHFQSTTVTTSLDRILIDSGIGDSFLIQL